MRALPLFVAVAETRSFTRAALRTALPISTLSRRIGALEASLGVRLFRRSTRVVELTEAGAIYLVRAQAIVAAAAEAHTALRGLAAVPRGVLRLSVDAELGPRLVAPVVADYLSRYPDVRIELDLSPRRVDLLAENFDLAIRIGDLPDSALSVRRLARLTGGLYAAPAYLAAAGTPAVPADLVGHRRIHLLHHGDRGEWRLRHAASGATIEIAAGSVVAANNMAMIRSLAGLGVGVAILDGLMARDDVASGVLLPVLPNWTLATMAVSVLTPARLVPAKTRLFIDLLVAAVFAVGLAP